LSEGTIQPLEIGNCFFAMWLYISACVGVMGVAAVHLQEIESLLEEFCLRNRRYQLGSHVACLCDATTVGVSAC